MLFMSRFLSVGHHAARAWNKLDTIAGPELEEAAFKVANDHLCPTKQVPPSR
jgi:hypothetical protein